jgi:exonuclease III
MNHRTWNILCWNIRGINSDKKWNSIRDRIIENNCDIACFQETKRASFDSSFIHNFCPPSFDSFEYLPSVGASGGSLIV